MSGNDNNRKKQAQRHPERVVYPVGYCPESYGAMKTLQKRLKVASGQTYSLSVIARSLALHGVHSIDTTNGSPFQNLCRRSATKGPKRKPQPKEATHAK
ncbi:hypothetical protein C8D92_101400 [Tamilnaduibacter salinus]|uniref:Uncharacterized protein n=1 Tax=Tamilnaduibacter salinus TaxID=1484056 RepID=A0A2U1D1N5_9GAMM|nr:hypothetical protein C8D92_101400 [Tamilnaduibacter salinus]